MQTRQQIEQLLASAGTSPRHRLGQNFLIDLNLMRFIVGSAGIGTQDVVIEVGCGSGSLTQALAQAAGRVVAVEYDRILAGIARDQLRDFANTEVINCDILRNKNTINPIVADAVEAARLLCGRGVAGGAGGAGGEKNGAGVKLVANLPYNVASSVMVNLIVGPLVVESMYVTVQKEVAQRCVAGAGSGEYGILSIVMAATGTAKILRRLKPSVFWPKPEVDSVIMSFQRIAEKAAQVHDMDLLLKVVHLFMGHRRKMLKACVKFADKRLGPVHHWTDIFERACVEPHRRPEQLSAEEYISIANNCRQYLQRMGGVSVLYNPFHNL